MKKKKIIQKDQIEKKAAVPVKIAWWPFLLLLLIVSIFIMHALVFSDLEPILTCRDKVLFTSLNGIRITKLVVLILLTVILLYTFIRFIQHRILKILFTSFIWLLLFFYGGELWLSVNPPSQGNNEAFVANIWFNKYWKSNKYGFRDEFYPMEQLKYMRNDIVFMGDSYVAGHGIKNPKDRTSNLLVKLLDNQYKVINVGKNGLGTRMEYTLIKGYPGTPSIVVLSHVANDIEEIIPQEETFSEVYKNITTPFSDFIYNHSRNSVFLDLIFHYVKLIEFGNKMTKLSVSKSTQPAHTYDWYKNDTLFNEHLKDIRMIYNYVTDTLQAKFILVTYPENYDLDSCDRYINNKIINALKSESNFHYLNVTPIFRPYKAAERRVGILDEHPSKLINKLVADSLSLLIRSEKFNADK